MDIQSDATLRMVAKDIIVDFFTEVGNRFDGHQLATNTERTDDLDPLDVRRVGHLIDAALVGIEVDWIGGTPLDQAELASFDDPVRLANDGLDEDEPDQGDWRDQLYPQPEYNFWDDRTHVYGRDYL